MLDIKLPIGLMFTLLGIVLTIFGLLTMSNSTMYQPSFNININIWSGLFMLVFGLFMLISSFRRKKR